MYYLLPVLMITPREPQENLVEYVTYNINAHVEYREWKIKSLFTEVRKLEQELLVLKRIQMAVQEEQGDQISPMESPLLLSSMEETPRSGIQMGVLRKVSRVRSNG